MDASIIDTLKVKIFIRFQLLMNPNVLLSGRQDAVCTAVMGAAVAVGGKMFFPKSNSNIACCPHCSGEVKQV